MIKAVIFDLGGVLIDLDIEKCRKAFIEELGYLDIDSLLDPCHQKGIYSDLEEGIVSEDEFRSHILAGSKPGSRPEDVDRCMWALLSGIAEDKVGFLQELSGKYDLYLLSNNNGISMPYSMKLFDKAGVPMESLFKQLFLSYRMKMLKPSRAIYDEVVKAIGLPASDLLFVDDSHANTDAADAAGINALYYTPGTDLRSAVSGKLEELQ